jgi:molecular chaperone GrpE
MSSKKRRDTSKHMTEMKEKKENASTRQKEKKAVGAVNDVVARNSKESEKETATTEAEQKEELTSEQEQQEAAKSLEEVIAELETENASLKDQLLRKQADFENFRKRMVKEKEEMSQYSNSMLLLDLIEIIDDFERAIKSSEGSKDFESFHSGVAMIEKQFTSMLERKWGLNRFDSEGKAFDPERHQAIATEESEEHDRPTVLEDYQKGYFLHDRVLRPAKVKVAQPKPETETSDKLTDNTEGIEGDKDGKNNRN